MKSFNTSKFLLFGLLVVMVAAVTFFPVRSFLSNHSVSADIPRFVKATTPEEASQIAGYNVAKLGFLPSDFYQNSIISVTDPSVPDSKVTLPKRVEQTWSSHNKYPIISLIQDPKLGGIGDAEGENTTIHNVNGKKVLLEANSNRPAILSFYWREGDMAYVLFGTLTGSVNEEVLRQVADSLE